MATLAITIPAGQEAGAVLRKLAANIQLAAAAVPDRNATGASVVLTIDNAPSAGTASVQVSGPYPSSLLVA